MSQPLIFVIGDAFRDRWVTVKRRGQSAEVNGLSIFDEVSVDIQPGGAANVQRALQLLALETRVRLAASRPMPFKTRYVEVGDPYRLFSMGRQVFRVDDPNNAYPLPVNDWVQYATWAKDVVVSDYGKGNINEEVLQAITSRARGRVWINAKVLQPYHRCADLAGDAAGLQTPRISWTCNEYEYLYGSEFYDKQPSVYVTSKTGVTHYQYGKTTNQAPSQVRKVVSVCGAGDVVLAALVTSGGSLKTAMAAAAIAVEHPGTYCPTAEEVEDRLKNG